MKIHVIALTIVILAGCGKPDETGPAQSQNIAPKPGPEETNSLDNAYATGTVTLKTGKKVAGEILMQCPGYLTVCFKINSSEPGSSELVRFEDVQSVMLEEALSDVDPMWMDLQKIMTVSTTEQSPAGDVLKAAPEE